MDGLSKESVERINNCHKVSDSLVRNSKVQAFVHENASNVIRPVEAKDDTFQETDKTLSSLNQLT